MFFESKRIFKNTGSLITAQIINKVLFLFLSIFIARFLGAKGLGEYSLIFGFMTIVGIVPGLGLNMLTTREIAKDKTKTSKYLGSILVLKVILAGAICIVLLILAGFFVNPELKLAFCLCSLIIVLGNSQAVFYSIFRAYEHMGYEAGVRIVSDMTIFGLATYMLLSGKGLSQVVLAFVLGNFLALIICWVIIQKNFSKPCWSIDVQFWKRLIVKSFYFWAISLLATFLLRTEIFLLYAFKGSILTGIYSAANNIVAQIVLLTSFFTIALFPRLSLLFKNNKKSMLNLYHQSLIKILIFTIPISVLLILSAKYIIFLIYGPSFLVSITILKIISLIIPMRAVDILITHYLFAMNKQKVVFIILSTGIILNLILGFILIPLYSFIGAIISLLTTNIILLCLNIYFVKNLNRNLCIIT